MRRTPEEHAGICDDCHVMFAPPVKRGASQIRGGALLCPACALPEDDWPGTGWPWCAIYWLYGNADDLLWVGHTENPYECWGRHGRAPWASQVTHKKLLWYSNRHIACAEERRVIREEQPRYNTQGRKFVREVERSL